MSLESHENVRASLSACLWAQAHRQIEKWVLLTTRFSSNRRHWIRHSKVIPCLVRKFASLSAFALFLGVSLLCEAKDCGDPCDCPAAWLLRVSGR